MYACFHSFHSLCFSLTLLLTSSFHHVSLCLAELFVHPQLLSAASSLSQIYFENVAIIFNRGIFLTTMYMLMNKLISLFMLSSYNLHIFLLGKNFLLLSSNFLFLKSHTNSLRWLIQSSFAKTFLSFKNFLWFL